MDNFEPKRNIKIKIVAKIIFDGFAFGTTRINEVL